MSAETRTIHEAASDVGKFLRRLVVRKRCIALLTALAHAITFALAWMLGWALVDRFIALPPGLRLSVDLVNVAAVISMLTPPILQLAIRKFDSLAAAEFVERLRPEFGQRLITFTSQVCAPRELRGSPQMLDSLADATDRHMRALRPAQLAPFQAAASAWLLAAAAALVVSLLLGVSWLDLPVLIARQLKPFAGIGAVSTTRLTVEPGDVAVVQGQSLQITARAHRLGSDEAVSLLIAPQGQPFASQPMNRQSDNQFTFLMTSVERDARYQITGGDARSDIYSIRVLRRPAVLRFEIEYEYPAYLKRPPAHATNTTGLIEAPAGSIASISVIATEPLRAANFRIGSSRISGVSGARPQERSAKIPVNESAKFRLELTSQQGVGMAAAFDGTIRAIPDQPPRTSLQLLSGTAISLDEPTSFLCRASDDYGISSLVLRAQVNASPARDIPIAIAGDVRSHEAAFAVDPAQLNARSGDVITVTLLATDAAGQASASDPMMLYLCHDAPDANSTARVGALRKAAWFAKQAAVDLNYVRKQTDAARTRGEIIVPDVARLARAEETSKAAESALLRAAIHSDSPATTIAMANMIDSAELLWADLAQARKSAEQFIPPDRRATQIASISEAARQLHASIDTMFQGHQAALILSQRRVLEAMTVAAGNPTTKPVTMGKLFDAISGAIEAAQRELGIDPRDSNVPATLQQRIDHGRQLTASQRPIDFVVLSRGWAAAPVAQPVFASRLRAASMVQALRPDANASAARDLHLASQAASALTTAETTRPAIEDPQRFPTALAAVLGNAGPKASADARAQMRAWADISPSTELSHAEADAFDAGAASAARDYPAARAADDRAAKVLGAAVGTQQHANADLVRQMADAQNMDQLIAAQKELEARTGAAATTKESQVLSNQQSALAAEIGKASSDSRHIVDAARSARRAADALASQTDPKAASTDQRAAISSLAAAWSQAIRSANLSRLATVPTFAYLFRTEEAGPVDPLSAAPSRPWARVAARKPGEVNTASRAPDPPGYQDALRAYFNALGLPDRPKAEQTR